MKLRMIFRFVPIVVMTISQTDSFYVERFASNHKKACNKEIRDSKTYKDSYPDKTFYIESDKHGDSVLAVSCGGYIIAKHRTKSCNSYDIRDNWNATCGNVAFMPCKNEATLQVGTSFEICVAGFHNYRLVYDEELGYFKISHNEKRLTSRHHQHNTKHDIVHVKAHVISETETNHGTERKIYIRPEENQESDARRMLIDQERTRGRHRLKFPTFRNPNDTLDLPTSYHMNLKHF